MLQFFRRSLTITQIFCRHLPAPGRSGRGSGEKVTPGEGLESHGFASEPMVRNPTDIDIDERGRVWVTEGVNYRSSFQKWGYSSLEGDELVVLEDTKGSAARTKKPFFYQDPSINQHGYFAFLETKSLCPIPANVFVLTEHGWGRQSRQTELLFTGISGVAMIMVCTPSLWSGWKAVFNMV